MRFHDRYEAGRELARRLSTRDWTGFVVVTVPRGGVPVGYEVARVLQLPLELWATRRLCAPGNPDESLGAASEDATVSLDLRRAEALGLSETELMKAAAARTLDAQAEGEILRSGRPRLNVRGRDILLVDDGVTSGGTLQATVRALRKAGARRIIVAVPVAPRSALDEMQLLVDDVIALEEPPRVESLADWYEDFRQPSDDEAIVLSWRVRAPPTPGEAPLPPGPVVVAPSAAAEGAATATATAPTLGATREASAAAAKTFSNAVLRSLATSRFGLAVSAARPRAPSRRSFATTFRRGARALASGILSRLVQPFLHAGAPSLPAGERAHGGGALVRPTEATGVPHERPARSIRLAGWRRIVTAVGRGTAETGAPSPPRSTRITGWRRSATAVGRGTAETGAPSPPRSTRITGWRRIATAVWRGPTDPQIFGILEVDARPALSLIESARRRGVHVTVTHVMGRAIAYALTQVPELNVRLRFGRHVPHPSIDLFFITAVSGGHDLTGVKVTGCDRKSVLEVAGEVARGATSLRSGSDVAFTRSKRFSERVPIALLRPTLRLLGWISGALGRDVRPLGLPRSPFGSAMVTSVGMFGLQIGFSPIAWLYHVPLIVLVGEITRQPVALDAEGDRVGVQPVLPITASIDHRFADGWQIAQLVRAFREYLSAPQRFEPWMGETMEPVQPVEDGGSGVPSPS